MHVVVNYPKERTSEMDLTWENLIWHGLDFMINQSRDECFPFSDTGDMSLGLYGPGHRKGHPQ